MPSTIHFPFLVPIIFFRYDIYGWDCYLFPLFLEDLSCFLSENDFIFSVSFLFLIILVALNWNQFPDRKTCDNPLFGSVLYIYIYIRESFGVTFRPLPFFLVLKGSMTFCSRCDHTEISQRPSSTTNFSCIREYVLP